MRKILEKSFLYRRVEKTAKVAKAHIPTSKGGFKAHHFFKDSNWEKNLFTATTAWISPAYHKFVGKCNLKAIRKLSKEVLLYLDYTHIYPRAHLAPKE